LDDVDRGILKFLRENARTSYVEIGKALGVSDATVYNRANRLLEMGVIKRFTIEVDDSLLGMRAKGFVLLNVKPGSTDEVSRRLFEIDGVREVHEVHGTPDLILKVQAEDLGSMRSIILNIREVPGVTQTEFIPVFKTWKE